MSFTNYLENAVLVHVFGSTAYSQPTIYVGLFTSAPDDTGGGTELSGMGYARQAMGSATISGTDPTQATNTNDVEFPQATDDWGEVTHCAWFDASTGGNMLAYAELDTVRDVRTGDILRFPAGSLKISLD